MKHTPGPWKAGRPDMATIVDDVESKWIYGGEGQNQYVAVASGRIYGDWDEVMANARLIAAAPELLEAVKVMTMLVRLKYGNLDKDVWEKIEGTEALIKRVEGEG